MKLAHKYDAKTKLFVEDVIVQPDSKTDSSAPVTYTLPTNCTFVQPVGLHTPKWNGKKWIEAGDPVVIADLKAQSAYNNSPLAKVRAQRAAAYPPMADYMDAVVKGDTVAQQAYIDACMAVKINYPKPV